MPLHWNLAGTKSGLLDLLQINIRFLRIPINERCVEESSRSSKFMEVPPKILYPMFLKHASHAGKRTVPGPNTPPADVSKFIWSARWINDCRAEIQEEHPGASRCPKQRVEYG